MQQETVSYDLDPDIEYDDSENKIKTKIYHTKASEYKIYNYDKDIITTNDGEFAQYRSVVFSFPENELLSFTTPQSICPSLFKLRYPDFSNCNNFIVNEIVDGLMITLFYDKRIKSWEIATKCAVGGDYVLHKTHSEMTYKTVSEMFMEELSITDMSKLDLPKNYSYHFVLKQQPYYPEVVGGLYLVEVYEIHPQNNSCSVVSQREYQSWPELSRVIKFPKIRSEKTYNELYEKYIHIHASPEDPGFMITNYETGERCRVDNPVNLSLKKHYRNDPENLYLYLCLRRIGKVKDYISRFPKQTNLFYTYYEQYAEFAKNIHQSYIDYYVKRTNGLVSDKYFKHIYALHHDVYLPSLMTTKRIITRMCFVTKNNL